jgi:peptide/nickel transport system permease protein
VAVLILIAQRIGLGIMTLLAVSILIFAGTELLPGDVASAILGQDATPEALEAIRRSLHLYDPAPVRYLRWLTEFLQGDLGVSLTNGQPVAAQITFRLLNTLFLATVTACVAVPLSVGLGIITAITRNSFFDRVVNFITLASISLPEFFIAYILILSIAVVLGWAPSLSSIYPGMSLGTKLYFIVLPVATLTLVCTAHMMRMTRTAIIGVLAHPFVEMAFLKGIKPWRIIVQHALPNALAPIITVIALNLAYLIVGVIVVEVVFVYPGIGQLMIDAVSRRDVPVVQACGLIFGGTYVSLNLIADVLSIASNPVLRLPK